MNTILKLTAVGALAAFATSSTAVAQETGGQGNDQMMQGTPVAADVVIHLIEKASSQGLFAE